MNKEEMIKAINALPLNELAEVVDVLANKVYGYRLNEGAAIGGGVPREVFESLLAMSGISVSVQTVNTVCGDVSGAIPRVGFALKRRTNEVGWESKYHNTCTVMRMNDSPQSALTRNAEEAFGFVPPNDAPSFLGVTIHAEPERRSSCVTIMHERYVSEDGVKHFAGDWKVYSTSEVELTAPDEVVDHNWPQLRWILDSRRPFFVDLR